MRFGSLELTQSKIEELQDGHPVVSLSRSEVSLLRVSHGFLGERVVLDVAVGGLVLAIGAGATWVTVRWLLYGGTISKAVPIGTTLVLVGVMMLFTSLRRGAVVVAMLRDGRSRKLALGREPSTVEGFLIEARRADWVVDRDPPSSRTS
jgi:hypothetical protein